MEKITRRAKMIRGPEAGKARHLFFFLAVFLCTALFVPVSYAQTSRQNVTDWYIQNFDSEIRANKDSSLDITEMISADCGRCAEKHGIFRILPEEINITGGGAIKTPVELVSITDFNGQPHKYTETRNRTDGTVTWKIGDPDRTVQGVNNYLIKYRVKNAIRFGNSQFDELYWNLSGNFWDLEIDKFHASLIFPSDVTQENSIVDYYSGILGGKGQDLATYRWTEPNVLEFDSTETFGVRQGLTASVTFPKNIFTPYQPTFWEKYNDYFDFLLPLIILFICLYLWRKYGDDPDVKKTVIPEYDIPGNLAPLEMGMLMTNGRMDKNFITAEIVNLAVKGFIKIKEADNKILLFNSKNYVFTKLNSDNASLNEPQKLILDQIFEKGNTVKLSSLKNSFYKVLNGINKKAENFLLENGLITRAGLKLKTVFAVIGVVLIVGSLEIYVREKGAYYSIYSIISVFLSGQIIVIFSLFMPKRTLSGAELNWKIKGFKLFMETVDKHRAEFYERENIFEKFLPYAIVFGITKIWIKKMQEIYGPDYFKAHAPVWYAGSLSSFDADSFLTAISSLSSSIAANTSSPSGSGGAGGSGGGGGGGGGGGW